MQIHTHFWIYIYDLSINIRLPSGLPARYVHLYIYTNIHMYILTHLWIYMYDLCLHTCLPACLPACQHGMYARIYIRFMGPSCENTTSHCHTNTTPTANKHYCKIENAAAQQTVAECDVVPEFWGAGSWMPLLASLRRLENTTVRAELAELADLQKMSQTLASFLQRDCMVDEGEGAGGEDTQWGTADGGTLTMHERGSIGLIWHTGVYTPHVSHLFDKSLVCRPFRVGTVPFHRLC